MTNVRNGQELDEGRTERECPRDETHPIKIILPSEREDSLFDPCH